MRGMHLFQSLTDLCCMDFPVLIKNLKIKQRII